MVLMQALGYSSSPPPRVASVLCVSWNQSHQLHTPTGRKYAVWHVFGCLYVAQPNGCVSWYDGGYTVELVDRGGEQKVSCLLLMLVSAGDSQVFVGSMYVWLHGSLMCCAGAGIHSVVVPA